MKREKSFRVFAVYAILIQFMLILSIHSNMKNNVQTTIQNYNPRNSVVQVLIAYESIDGNETAGLAYTGTGTAIAIENNTVYVITARHVCKPIPDMVAAGMGIRQVTEIQNSTGEYFSGDVRLISMTDDLCVISYETPDATALAIANIAPNAAFLDEKVSMYAAPAGFYVPSAITQFFGIHAGNIMMEGGVSSVYTIPASGGSSGALLLNSKGEGVGILHSTLSEFHHVSLASTHQAMIGFIEELEATEGIIILD